MKVEWFELSNTTSHSAACFLISSAFACRSGHDIPKFTGIIAESPKSRCPVFVRFESAGDALLLLVLRLLLKPLVRKKIHIVKIGSRFLLVELTRA
jgi:hypothetical protein